MMKIRLKTGMDTKISIGVITFCVLNYFYFIPNQVKAEGSSVIYPMIVNTLMFIFSIGYFFQSAFGKNVEGEAPLEYRAVSYTKGSKPLLKVVLIIISLVIWVSILEYVGFLLSSILFLFITTIIFGSRSYWKNILVSLVLPLSLYFLFRVLLNSALPDGILEQLLEKLIYG